MRQSITEIGSQTLFANSALVLFAPPRYFIMVSFLLTASASHTVACATTTSETGG